MGEITLEIELNAFPVFNSTGSPGIAAVGLVAAVPAVTAANVSITYSVSGVEMHARLIEFDASVNMALSQMVATSGLYIHGCTWTSQFQTMAVGHKTITCNEKYRSLKLLFFSFNPSATTNALRKTSRHNNGMTSYQ